MSASTTSTLAPTTPPSSPLELTGDDRVNRFDPSGLAPPPSGSEKEVSVINRFNGILTHLCIETRRGSEQTLYIPQINIQVGHMILHHLSQELQTPLIFKLFKMARIGGRLTTLVDQPELFSVEYNPGQHTLSIQHPGKDSPTKYTLT